jgi:hypothetical protein
VDQKSGVFLGGADSVRAADPDGAFAQKSAAGLNDGVMHASSHTFFQGDEA